MVEVKRDINIRMLGAQRLECFDSTAWNRYYSIIQFIAVRQFYKELNKEELLYKIQKRIVKNRVTVKSLMQFIAVWQVNAGAPYRSEPSASPAE